MAGERRRGFMVAGLAACAAAILAAGAGAEDARLAGRWVAVEAQRDGAPAPALVGHRLAFEGERFQITGKDGGLIYGGSFTSDQAANPPAIDFRNDEGQANGVTWEGVYRMSGDRLTIIDNAPDPTKPRPMEFRTAPGDGYVMLVFGK